MNKNFCVLILSLLLLSGCNMNKKGTLENIEIISYGKMEYLANECFDPTGYKIKASYSNNTTKEINVTQDMVTISMIGEGKIDGTISYTDGVTKTASFIVTKEIITDKVSSFEHISRQEEVDATYQLYNGDFETGNLDGWYQKEGSNTFEVTDSDVDIWKNPVRKGGTSYLGFGEKNYNQSSESKTGIIRSSLFKVGGIGLVSFKLGGSASENLKVSIMKYNKDKEDELITICNNVRFSLGNLSGFIMIQYYYQFDLSLYQDSLCYFLLSDNDTSSFGYINMDNINTYYEFHEPVYVSDICAYVNLNDYQAIQEKSGDIISVDTYDSGKRIYELGEEFDIDRLTVYATYEKSICAMLSKDEYIIDKHNYKKDIPGIYEINIQVKDSVVHTSYNVEVLKQNEKIKGHISLTGNEQFLLLGSSLAQFWTNYKNDLSVISNINNIGVGGSQLPYWIERVKNLPIKDFTHLICFLGVNDVLSGGKSPEQIKDLLNEFLDTVHAEMPDTKIYLLTMFLSPCTYVGTFQTVRDSNRYYKEIAAERDYLTIIDCETLFVDENCLPINSKFVDGIHFQPASYIEIAHEIKKYFE